MFASRVGAWIQNEWYIYIPRTLKSSQSLTKTPFTLQSIEGV